ncbi:O-antigen polymerase, partial [Salmonella enterica]|nr:O-antigen polymerase [Salmonella enterica]EBO2011312.1 O-antigen polymerase [Salmonella enterica subsp. enterica serovar Schwarzengrund]ECY6242525.1 O-antigen polymerase [Salmonella enterica subsp. enterica serovar Bredeney]EAY9350412.1 O-antigen polymerase [Salmonella enterica]ECD8682873.1 O-antigen polymerase [Salmonella enterica subsp. enterica serovar Schwarzengrund]
ITSSLLLRFTSSVNFVILSRVIYIYFVCDSLFRFNRDPWFIAIKMFVNNIVFILFVLMIIALKMRMEKRRAIQ